MATLLLAAAVAPDADLERLRAMPAGERARLLERLRTFDLTLSPEQQSAVRDLDRRISELSPGQRARYQAVLRRYHAWLSRLPEQRQGEVTSKPPADRMALIRKFIGENPVPADETPRLLRVLEPGEYNPYEVASAFRIWQALSDSERADLLRRAPENARRQELFRHGERPKYGIPRETIRDGFDEERWVGRLRAEWGGIRAIAQLEDLPKSKLTEAVKKRIQMLRPEIQRRQAINLFVSRTPVRSVDPERLSRFVAALPPWVSSSFDSLAPDEARRRSTFAYRQVFPYPEEIGAVRPTAGQVPRGRAAGVPKVVAPPRAKPKPPGNGAPF